MNNQETEMKNPHPQPCWWTIQRSSDIRSTSDTSSNAFHAFHKSYFFRALTYEWGYQVSYEKWQSLTSSVTKYDTSRHCQQNSQHKHTIVHCILTPILSSKQQSTKYSFRKRHCFCTFRFLSKKNQNKGMEMDCSQWSWIVSSSPTAQNFNFFFLPQLVPLSMQSVSNKQLQKQQ